MLRNFVSKISFRSSGFKSIRTPDILPGSAHCTTSACYFSNSLAYSEKSNDGKSRDPRYQMTRAEEGAIRNKKHDESGPEQAKEWMKSIEILPGKTQDGKCEKDTSKPGKDLSSDRGTEQAKLKDEHGKSSKKEKVAAPERATAKDGLTNEELNQKLRGNPSTS